VPLPDGDILPAMIATLFGEQHERIYGFRAPPEEPVELIGLSGMARGLPERPRLPERIPPLAADVPSMRRAWFPEMVGSKRRWSIASAWERRLGKGRSSSRNMTPPASSHAARAPGWTILAIS
jgi:hypothetical protein